MVGISHWLDLMKEKLKKKKGPFFKSTHQTGCLFVLKEGRRGHVESIVFVYMMTQSRSSCFLGWKPISEKVLYLTPDDGRGA